MHMNGGIMETTVDPRNGAGSPVRAAGACRALQAAVAGRPLSGTVRPVQPAPDSGLSVQGLRHDLGHQLLTLSLLAESVRDDKTLSADSRRRMELVAHEMLRALDMITDYTPAAAASPAGGNPASVDVRALAGEITQLAELASETSVGLCPGQPAPVLASPTLLWRVLWNLVDNAVRAAGPGGRVQISVQQEIDTVIEITDDGPGFGTGPDGTEGLGLSVTQQLLDLAGGRLEIGTGPGGGTCVRVILGLEPAHSMVPACAGPWH